MSEKTKKIEMIDYPDVLTEPEQPVDAPIIEDAKGITLTSVDEKDQKIATLEASLADLSRQMGDMMTQFQATLLVKNAEVVETKVNAGITDLDDDREDIVEISYNTPNSGFIHKELPKREAVKHLYEWFRNKKHKVPDHGDVYDKNLDETREVNLATCYIRMRKRDLATGKYKTVMHEVPLWIAVDRMLQGNDVELIARGEYNKAVSERMQAERQFNEDYYNKKKLKALESIAKLPQ